MHFGEVKFKQRGREEQCEPDGTSVSRWELQLIHFFYLFKYPHSWDVDISPTTSTKTESTGYMHHLNHLTLFIPSTINQPLKNSMANRRWEQSGCF